MEKVISTFRSGEYSTKSVEETARCLIDVHIPDDRESEDTLEQREIRTRSLALPNTADASLFTAIEVAAAIKSFRKNKAPRPELIETAVLRAAKVIPDQMLRLLNGCLQWGVFPSI